MATGTVTVHSWNDGAEEDEAEPPMGANFNCRLDMREDYNALRLSGRSREDGRGLRSNVVRPQRLGMDVEDDDTGGEGGW
jgi:DDB1- and CUL4-associated factor 11